MQDLEDVLGAILAGDGERLAQFGGRGGTPDASTPGMSHWHQRSNRGQNGQNDFSIDHSFDSYLQKGRRPLPVDDHNVESRLEPFHAYAEGDALGYVLNQDQRKKWRVKQQIRQKMLNLANDSAPAPKDEGYPDYEPLERMLDERHKNNNLKFSDEPAEQAKPTRRHYAERMAQNSIFDMNTDSSVLRRTQGATPMNEFNTEEDFERQPADKYRQQTPGMGNTPMVGDPHLDKTTFDDFDDQLASLSKEWTSGQGDGLYHERTLAFGDGDGEFGNEDEAGGNLSAPLLDSDDDVEPELDKMLTAPKHTGNLEHDLNSGRTYQEQMSRRLRELRKMRVQTIQPGGVFDLDSLRNGPEKGKFESWDGNAQLYQGGSGFGSTGMPWSPRT